MGLDNGFILKSKDNSFANVIEDIKTDKEGYYCVDLAYFRKHWGFRNALHKTLHFSNDGGEYVVDVEDIPAVLRIMKNFMKEQYYNDNADSIWTYEESLDTFVEAYIQMTKMIEWLNNHPDDKVIWYDSY